MYYCDMNLHYFLRIIVRLIRRTKCVECLSKPFVDIFVIIQSYKKCTCIMHFQRSGAISEI